MILAASARFKSSSDPLPKALLAAAVLVLLAALALRIDLAAARIFEPRMLDRTIPAPLGPLAKVVDLAETFGYGATVVLVVLLVGQLDPAGLRSLPRLLAGPFGAGLAANVVKMFVARARPKAATLDGAVLETFAGLLPIFSDETRRHTLQSFPSAHTATAFGLATVLACRYPRGAVMFYAFAALAGLQRVQTLEHFTSDVLCGAALGIVVGAACCSPKCLGGWFNRLEGTGSQVQNPLQDPPAAA